MGSKEFPLLRILDTPSPKATDSPDGSQGLSMLPWTIGVYLAGITLTLPISFLTGFEGCSMVPTIYPLETLHNALSLRQVSEFLSSVCQRHTDAQAQASAGMENTLILYVCLCLCPCAS